MAQDRVLPSALPTDKLDELDLDFSRSALEAGGVRTKVGDSKRDRVFCARAIPEIPEEPARLVPESPASKRRASRA
jgi:hypothetical protein